MPDNGKLSFERDIPLRIQEVVVKLNVNGADVEVDDRFTGSPLLWVLRDVLELHGPKYGCGIGFCAACTVLIDGHNTKSCQTPAGTAVGKAVTTVEGASGPVIDAIRDAWYRGNVVQCGYCQPGQTPAAAALLRTADGGRRGQRPQRRARPDQRHRGRHRNPDPPASHRQDDAGPLRTARPGSITCDRKYRTREAACCVAQE
jgi:aerobic-type carbon monoxide dehydrogenase small subunit (CoxS/CutS family)